MKSSSTAHWGRLGQGIIVGACALAAVACDQPETAISVAPEALTSVEESADESAGEPAAEPSVAAAISLRHGLQDDPSEVALPEPIVEPPPRRLSWERPARHAEADALSLTVEGPRGVLVARVLPTSSTGIDLDALADELPDGFYSFQVAAWPAETVRPAPPEPRDTADPGAGLSVRERIEADAFIETEADEEVLDPNGRDVRDGAWEPVTHDGLFTDGAFWIRDGELVPGEAR